MKINELVLKNFRNHINSEAKFSENINVIWGNNGAGKTSILEAISVCSISRSFVSHSDISVLNKNAENYTKYGFLWWVGSVSLAVVLAVGKGVEIV
jgi:DNA replication and repair protein RecF